MCRYHGPPLKQLKQLSSQGTYKTRQPAVAERWPSDSICWPVEAYISLPTPHHISSLALITSSHEAQVTPSPLHRQSFGIPSKVGDFGLLPQQGKEENKHGEWGREGGEQERGREGGEQRERGREGGEQRERGREGGEQERGREGGEQRETGRVVYDCSKGTEEVMEEDSELIFESRFEGGNLHQARQM